MGKADLKRELSDLKGDLRSFFACLNRFGILEDQSILGGILASVDESSKGLTAPKWAYSLSKAELRLEVGQVRWPANPASLVCVFDLTIAGTIGAPVEFARPRNKRGDVVSCPAELGEFTVPSGSSCWEIEKLAVDLQLLAHAEGGAKWQQFWHFDRHITEKPSTTGKARKDATEIHPLFHFNFGGDRLADCRVANTSNWGNLLELEAPRIAHPPLDLVLLIDFILANFSGATWRNLAKNQKEYLEIVESAQRRFWGPYNCALSDFFKGNSLRRDRHVALQFWPSLAIGRPPWREGASPPSGRVYRTPLV